MKALELREAERFCGQMARRDAKNFYWGFVSLPYEQRIAIYALYDFARQVDDAVDSRSGDRTSTRVQTLAPHRERVRRCMRGEYSDPVMHVLAGAVARHGILESELQALIDGVEMDELRSRYETWDELREYCRLVASVVGRMCVRIFGFTNPEALERADELGQAMQVTNILRDVREDAAMGRIYLPLHDLKRFGVEERELLDGRPPAETWRALVEFEVRRARALFEGGFGVLAFIPRRSAVCVQTMAGIYHRILDKIERDPLLPFRERASLSGTEKLHIVVGSWLNVV